MVTEEKEVEGIARRVLNELRPSWTIFCVRKADGGGWYIKLTTPQQVMAHEIAIDSGSAERIADNIRGEIHKLPQVA